jgi:hypothetical protein
MQKIIFLVGCFCTSKWLIVYLLEKKQNGVPLLLGCVNRYKRILASFVGGQRNLVLS